MSARVKRLCRKSAESSISQIGLVNWSTMAFAAVVSLFATEKQVSTTASITPPSTLRMEKVSLWRRVSI